MLQKDKLCICFKYSVWDNSDNRFFQVQETEHHYWYKNRLFRLTELDAGELNK